MTAETRPAPARTRAPTPLPPRSAWLFDWFAWYGVRYLRKHFHAVRLSKASVAVPPGDAPLLVVLNHPSWWDGLIGFPLLPLFPPGRAHYGAIDAEAVGKYKFMSRLGFFPVDTGSVRGAAGFLRTGGAVLAELDTAVWVTGQGRFTDARVRPLGLQSGVGHLAARMPRGYVVPLAVEYTYWTERTPEALLRVGEPLDVASLPGTSGKEWAKRIEAALTDTLDGLAADGMARDPARFTTLVSGKAGVGGPYDWWRRAVAWARGRRFDPTHGGETR